MRVRVGARQLQVLRLLYTHRLLTTAQVHALAPHVAYVVVGTWFVQLLRRHPDAAPRPLMADALAALLAS